MYIAELSLFLTEIRCTGRGLRAPDNVNEVEVALRDSHDLDDAVIRDIIQVTEPEVAGAQCMVSAVTVSYLQQQQRQRI